MKDAIATAKAAFTATAALKFARTATSNSETTSAAKSKGRLVLNLPRQEREVAVAPSELTVLDEGQLVNSRYEEPEMFVHRRQGAGNLIVNIKSKAGRAQTALIGTKKAFRIKKKENSDLKTIAPVHLTA
jgi:hypothetical protein